jgi:hypothetical protein
MIEYAARTKVASEEDKGAEDVSLFVTCVP